ncbi:hypothetical protein [Campylobacter estrildidarum]|uniref:Uncharacterized protein n=1 Tax=Campylobacter estrildidarum TaxID=2510189 RepID=A0A4U7BSB3_9BACT|nr:hypothetical protein [Campylobacter estrildidarum]TKX31147.1 hypothetical protein CQA69_04210 [Campylobacter estrildidarum]
MENIFLDSDLEFLPDGLDGLSVLVSALSLSCESYDTDDIHKALSIINERLVQFTANSRELIDLILKLLNERDAYIKQEVQE